jgi:hypothetical protein
MGLETGLQISREATEAFDAIAALGRQVCVAINCFERMRLLSSKTPAKNDHFPDAINLHKTTGSTRN